jgi:hypothetical protein
MKRKHLVGTPKQIREAIKDLPDSPIKQIVLALCDEGGGEIALLKGGQKLVIRPAREKR